MRILHIITALGNGGAENTLYKICKYDNANEHIVISLKGPGKYYRLLKKLGINVYFLNIKFYSFYKFFFLLRLIYFLKPNIVQTWLIHADFIGGIAAKLIGIKNIIWNIRYTKIKLGKSKFTSVMLVRILSYLSFFIPRYIVVVSKKSKKIYKTEGYDKKKFIYIPNGYDFSILKPNKFERKKFRDQIKIKKKTLLIGNVARYDPKKDHFNLLKALSLLKFKKNNFFCILVGPGVNKNNIELNSLIKNLNLSNKVKLLDQKNNISQIMNGIDIYVQSSSYGEGFPNVVAESMSCGTPCIVTDVGDAPYIVDKIGWVVPPNDETKLAKSIESAFVQFGSKKWNKRSEDARKRIIQKFNIKKMISSYNRLWIRV
jgi:glycosyltransferase involved in cell wall biosynthesis